jgi:hypothetical protein
MEKKLIKLKHLFNNYYFYIFYIKLYSNLIYFFLFKINVNFINKLKHLSVSKKHKNENAILFQYEIWNIDLEFNNLLLIY